MSTDAPEVPERAASSVNRYFTKEITDQIAEMTVVEMEAVLKEMISARQFIAILKYSSMRMPLLDAQLRGTNPILDPHKISWSQGALAGLSDLETYIIDLNAPPRVTTEKDEDSMTVGTGLM